MDASNFITHKSPRLSVLERIAWLAGKTCGRLGTNAFGNSTLADVQKQSVLHLDQNNNPEVLQFITPRPTVPGRGTGGAAVGSMAQSMTLTPSAGTQLGFTANLFRGIGQQPLGTELEPGSNGADPKIKIYGPTQSVFNASTNPAAYTGTVPSMDGMLGLGTNAVPTDPEQRGGGSLTMPNGTTKTIPVGTSFDKAQGGSGNTLP
jgi:hypothetical protein